LTGATSGLGRWLAPRLAAAGLTLLVHGRDPAKVDRTVTEGRATGARADGHVAHRAGLAECDRPAAEVAARVGLTALGTNAGAGVNCLPPASLMGTAMVQQSGYPPLSTPDEGGPATLRLILDVDSTGGYDAGPRLSRAHPDAYRPEVWAALRAATEAALNHDR